MTAFARRAGLVCNPKVHDHVVVAVVQSDEYMISQVIAVLVLATRAA